MNRPKWVFRANRSALALACAASVHAQVVITTIAGTDRLFPGSSLNALKAPLGQTNGLALDSAGNLYIADTGNQMVMRLSPDGTLAAVAGNGKGAYSGDGGPALKASLNQPTGVAVDTAGNLYIADELNCRIRKVTSDGIITTIAGTGIAGFSGDGGPANAAQLNNPYDVKLDGAGNLFIADSLNQRIREVSSAGIISSIAGNGNAGYSGDGGNATAASLNVPLSIALDGAGNLYISDNANQRIRKVSAGGTISTIAGNGQAGFSGDGGAAAQAQFNGPADLAVDRHGNLFIVDSLNCRLRQISSTGTINTVAGSGIQRFAGDGGPAVAASLDVPIGVAVDGAGNLYIADTNSRRVRRVGTDGTIQTLAGNGGPFSGDGGPASGAVLNYPFGVALDGKGNLLVADTYNNRIRKVAPDGTISTVAGNGAAGFSGDGAAAVNAALNTPSGVAVDSAGNLYLADTYNDRIRRVSPGGVITTIAGSGNVPGQAGDGGPATAAVLNGPRGVAVQGNSVFIADSRNNLIRKIGADGVITTVAGTGTAGYAGDGGASNQAQLNQPSAIALDGAGNLYIADTLNNRVRKVTPAGMITTIAGNGVAAFSGDGGPATQAAFLRPTGLTVDPAGNLYVVDAYNCRVRIVSAADGTVNTFAGSGPCQYSGDGGLATSASLNYPFGITTDGAGNFYIADIANGRIREVLAPGAAIPFQAAPAALTFAANAGGAAPASQTIRLSSLVPGLTYSSAAQSSWLNITPAAGALPGSLNVSVDPSGLAPGIYNDTIAITVPDATPPLSTIAVTFTVGSAQAPALSIDAASLSFSAAQGGPNPSGQIHVSNSGSGSVTFTASAATQSGASWLSVSPSSSMVTATAPATLTVSIDTSGLSAGTYTGSITLATATSTAVIPVNLLVTAPRAVILLSQKGLSFRSAAAGAPLPQSFAIINTGQGSMAWSATAVALSSASNWLHISPASGSLARPLLDVGQVQVSIDPTGLNPGDYYGRIDVTSAASNSPQTVTIVLTVAQPTDILEPEVLPIGLVFTGAAGVSPGSQDILVGNPEARADNFLSSQIGTAFSYLPSSAQLPPGQPQTLRVYPNFTQLSAGTVQHGTITLQFADGTARTISILTVAGAAPSSAAQTAGSEPRDTSGACAPTQLIPTFTILGNGGPVPAGYPVTVQVAVVDDCGSPFTSGSVQASFSNGDPLLALVNLQNGSWAGTWQVGTPASSVQITVTAQGSAGLIGKAQASINQQGQIQTLPVISGSGLVSAASLLQGPFAPGDVILIRGSSLADYKAQASSSPLQQQLAGAAVAIGGKLAPLLYADANQVVALVPSDLETDTPEQLLVQRDASLAVPAGLVISATHPAILTQDGSGTGQGSIYAFGANPTILADSSHPVKPGDQVLIYCAGLGITDSSGNTVNTVSVSIGGQSAKVTYAGVALAQDYPATGAPSVLGGLAPIALGGLNQITASVPQNVANGTVPVVVTSAGQNSQAGVMIVISGGSNAPAIASIDTAGGVAGIAQNDRIEIKGSNLAPATVGAGITWSNAPEFSSGMLPAQLGGVSVKVDGKPAFTYYVSTTQINVLTPLDATTGPVQVVVTSAGVSSAPFTVLANPVAPSFLLSGSTRYILATHADGTLVGPTQMSAPGYPFAPAQSGETIQLYGVGFGLPSAPLTNGSSSQSGALPSLPSIEVGGIPAHVAFAGVISPGLYQLNVTIPSGVRNGDNVVSCAYQGFSTPTSDLLAIGQ